MVLPFEINALRDLTYLQTEVPNIIKKNLAAEGAAIVEAPIAAGQPVAELKIDLEGEEVLRTPLRALDDNPTGSFWQRTRDSVSLMFE